MDLSISIFTRIMGLSIVTMMIVAAGTGMGGNIMWIIIMSMMYFVVVVVVVDGMAMAMLRNEVSSEGVDVVELAVQRSLRPHAQPLVQLPPHVHVALADAGIDCVERLRKIHITALLPPPPPLVVVVVVVRMNPEPHLRNRIHCHGH